MVTKRTSVPGAGRPGLQRTALGIQDGPSVGGLSVVAAVELEDNEGTLIVGRVNVVQAADEEPVTLQIAAGELDTLVGQRVGLKVTWGEGSPGTIEVTVADGFVIEADTGLFGASTGELEGQMYGRVYREWICDADGRWLLVGFISAPSVG
jgi:hypothetical protein